MADEKKTIGFIAREYVGFEVFLPGRLDQPLERYRDIKPGDTVIVRGIFGEYIESIVNAVCTYSETENAIYLLEFNGDERHCWVCKGCIMKSAMQEFVDASKKAEL